MTPPPKPSVSISKVPSVKELCELLGFQYASLKETNTFMESTRAWRKSYHTSSGRRGTEILNWNQISDQLDLEDMAQNFINDRGNGERFWSSGRSWNHDSDLQFPEDRARIVALLKQLFWKQNRYAWNNLHYGHKSESQEQSREKASPVRQFYRPTRADSPTSLDSALVGSGSEEVKSISPRNPPQPAALDETNHNPPPAEGSRTEEAGTVHPDIYEILDDSDHDEYIAAPRTLKRPHPVSQTLESPSKKNKYRSAGEPRRTGRNRRVRSLPDMVPENEVEQLINDAIENDERSNKVQFAETPSTTGPSKHTMPEIESMGAPANSNISFPRGPPVAERPAPTAPMFAPNIHKVSSPLSKAYKISRKRNLFDLNRSSASSLSQNNSTSQMGKSKSSESTSLPQIESVQRKENNNSKITHSSPSGQQTQDDTSYGRSTSATTDRVNTMDENLDNRDSGLPQPSIAAYESYSNADGHTSDARGLSTHSDDNGKASPTTDNFAPSPELPPSRSAAQSHTPPGTSSTLKSVSEKVTEDSSEMKASERSSETVDNVRKSTTASAQPNAAQKTEPPQNSTSQASTSKPRPKTHIPLWIITREPRYTEERWDEGKFLGTPLPTFIEGISKVTQRSHIEKIKLTLRAPTFDTKITVFKDAEDSWASAKETFIEKLKEAKAEARARRQMEQVAFKILVEPFYEEGMFSSGSVDEYEEEFDF